MGNITELSNSTFYRKYTVYPYPARLECDCKTGNITISRTPSRENYKSFVTTLRQILNVKELCSYAKIGEIVNENNLSKEIKKKVQ